MSDRMPMAPCQADPGRGGHRLMAILRDQDDTVTLACRRCGAIRRVPIDDDMPLDEMDAGEVARRVGARP